MNNNLILTNNSSISKYFNNYLNFNKNLPDINIDNLQTDLNDYPKLLPPQLKIYHYAIKEQELLNKKLKQQNNINNKNNIKIRITSSNPPTKSISTQNNLSLSINTLTKYQKKPNNNYIKKISTPNNHIVKKQSINTLSPKKEIQSNNIKSTKIKIISKNNNVLIRKNKN